MSHKKSYFTLLEIMVATAIIGTMVLGVIEFMNSQQRYIADNKDKKYALLKANQMLNELRTYIEDTGETSGNVDTLDRLSSLKPNPLLTMMPLPASAMNDYKIVLSNNFKMNEDTHLSSWKFLRTVHVVPVGVGGTRQVTVKIYKGKDFKDFPDSNDFSNPLPNGYYPQPVISLITVLPTIGDIDFEAQQVFDYYNIAIENIPGWWVHMSELLPVAQAAISDVDTENDGLTIRNHWITRLGYGRDRFYAPYLNIVKDSYQPSENAFYYPGKLPAGFAKPDYYVPTLMKCHMQSDSDSPTTAITYINGFNPYFTSELLLLDPLATTTAWNQYNPHPYAPADYLNNPMRYADMKKIYELRDYEAKRAWFHKNVDRSPEKNPGLLEISREDNIDFAKSEDYFMRVGQGEEMPWALLLDELSMRPEKFRNAIFMNLHGELLPMPPIRNYSDAAFSSTGINIQKPDAALGRYDYFRAVAHPEKIRYHAKNKSGVALSTDELDNIDTQNPFLRVYGYLSEPMRGATWRSAGANNVDNMSGVKKGRLDDEEESPITISIRFHKSTFKTAGGNEEFNAWRDLIDEAAAIMRRDRYVSFFEGGANVVGGVNDLNNRPVYYGTNYTSANWSGFQLGSSIDVPTEYNEGWGYLNHALDSADVNAAKSISQDGFRKKGLGVEPLGLKYTPYFYLDYSLDATKNEWFNVMYFHQRDSQKVHYNNADDAAADAADLGLNVDYMVGATSATLNTFLPNNILKGAGVFSTTPAADMILSGFSLARRTNPAGWTPHFIGVTPNLVDPTLAAAQTGPTLGASEWYAHKIPPVGAEIVGSNGSGLMYFWTGDKYDKFDAPKYHSFTQRNLLRGLGLATTDSLLGETEADYWNFALLGPDPIGGKYEMLYLSNRDWVPLQAGLNFPASKIAWDDSMNWSLSGTVYLEMNAVKTGPIILAQMTAMLGTGKYLVTNETDTLATTNYYIMTTVIPGESSGLPFVPTKGMIIDDKLITNVLGEYDPNDPVIIAAFKNIGLPGTRYFKITMSAQISAGVIFNVNSKFIIPKVGVGESVIQTGAVLDLRTPFYKPAVGMIVFDSTGSNPRTIVSVQNYTEPVVAIGNFASTPLATWKVTLNNSFPGVSPTVYMLAIPAIQSKPISNESQPTIVNPQKRGLTVYADSKPQLDSYVSSSIAGTPNYVKYGVVSTPATTESSNALTQIYRLNYAGGIPTWEQTGKVGRKLGYNAFNPFWNRIPCYDRMWAEIEYAFIHTPKQSKWLAKEIIGSDKNFTGDHCIIITLHNTPMATPSETSTTINTLMTGLTVTNGMSGGLLRSLTPTVFTNDRRLYQLEYIPCAVRDSHKPTGGVATTVTNTLDLLSNDNLPKNTARWRIKLPSRTQLSADILAEQGALCVREAGVSSSLSITNLDQLTKDFFNTPAGGIQLKEAFQPLTFETRIGGITTAIWNNMEGKDLVVAVGSNTDLTGTGAPTSVTIKNGYFIDVYKDIADWTLWAKINEVAPLLNDDCRTHNNSRSFTWLVDNIASYPNLSDEVRIPFSEKFQTYGDPRHMPYMDTKDNFVGTNKGYNWFFASNTDANNWLHYTGFGKKQNNYTGPMEADVPKLFMWLREGLVNANALWCSITGYSSYIIGLGNEIGYDTKNGFPNSIPVHMKAWGVNSSSTGYENSVTLSVISIKNRSGTWEGRHYLGELFPEWEYTNFTKSDTDAIKLGGGLPTGYTAASDIQYQRFDRENSKYLENKLQATRKVLTTGCSAMLNVESSVTAGQKFNHVAVADTNTGTIATDKLAMILDAFRIKFATTLSANSPWIITEAANTPLEWTDYSAWRKEGLMIDNKTNNTINNLMDSVLYRDNSNRVASGVLEIHDKGATSDRGKRKKALFVINGLSQMSVTGADSISDLSVVSLLYGFLRGGAKRYNPNIFPSSGTLVTKDEEPAFIRELPRINIISPKIIYPVIEAYAQVRWTLQWRRWDGKQYWGNNNAATDPDYWKTEYAEPIPDGNLFFRVIFSEGAHSSASDWNYVSKPLIKTSAGLTHDKLISDQTTYLGSDQDIVEIDGDEIYGGNTQPGREAPVGADTSPFHYRLDWKMSDIKINTSYAFRVECHRRQHTIYYIDGTGVEKAYENDANAVSRAKEQRKYMGVHFSYQQGLMVREQ